MNKELKYLNDHKYFDVENFKNWLSEEFPEPMRCSFTRDLIDNILDEAATEYNYEDGQFCNRLVNMIPELTWDDVIQFADALLIDSKGENNE